MSTATFTIPGNPIPKARARVVNGHAFTPERTSKAEGVVRLFAKGAGLPQRAGPVILAVTFFRADRRRVDIDNMLKLVQDALNPSKKDPWGAWLDDSQIVSLQADRFYDPKNPRTVVTISDAEDARGAT